MQLPLKDSEFHMMLEFRLLTPSEQDAIRAAIHELANTGDVGNTLPPNVSRLHHA
jgi:hypothetical protein